MTLVVNHNVIKFVQTTKNSELSSLFFVVLSLVALFFLSSCDTPESVNKQKLVFSGPMMGTQYRITVVSDRPLDSEGQVGIEQRIVAAMQAVNDSMSTYIPSSELNRFNRIQAHQAMPLSSGLYDVVKESLQISEMSQGAFDITLGGVVSLWGFGPDGAITRVPDDSKLQEIRQAVGYQKLKLEAKSLSKHSDGVTIDLSAIAKGYAVDQVAIELSDSGFTDFLVDIGGELRASGRNANGQVWRVGVEKPHVLGGVQDILLLENKAIATSGDYRNYHVIEGKHYSHTIDSSSLKPVFHQLALVSVISDKTSTADALATTLMVMGERKGLEFAKAQGLSVYMVIRGDSENDFKIQMTDGFKNHLL